MNPARRFVFRGQASGISAHLRRPHDLLLPVHGCSSLPVIGGRSTSHTGPQKLGDFLSFESAETSAQGDFVNAQDALAMTYGKVAWDASPTKTTISAQVKGFRAGGRLVAETVAMGLVSHSPVGLEQPSILLSGNRIEGVSIDKHRLKITLAEDFLNQNDTENKLRDHWAKGPENRRPHLFPIPEGMPAEQFPSSAGMTLLTVVDSIEWEGEPHRDATIDNHVLTVPNFGKVYFGEMLITGISRRLTMVRFRFGSDDGGECTIGEGETNGSYYP